MGGNAPNRAWLEAAAAQLRSGRHIAAGDLGRRIGVSRVTAGGLRAILAAAQTLVGVIRSERHGDPARARPARPRISPGICIRCCGACTRRAASAAILELDLSLERLLPVGILGGLDAAARLLAAHRAAGRVLVVGDFDADGATSTALVVRALRALHFAHVDFLVPNRFRFGYGLTPEIVALAATRAPSLIVTVDNGVSSVAGVEAAREIGDTGAGDRSSSAGSRAAARRQ